MYEWIYVYMYVYIWIYRDGDKTVWTYVDSDCIPSIDAWMHGLFGTLSVIYVFLLGIGLVISEYLDGFWCHDGNMYSLYVYYSIMYDVKCIFFVILILSHL